MKVDLDNDSITLTARGRDHTFENVGVAASCIAAVVRCLGSDATD